MMIRNYATQHLKYGKLPTTMKNIVTYLNDIFEAQEKGKNVRWRWLDRFASFFAERFGPDWQEKDKEFWEQFKYRI